MNQSMHTGRYAAWGTVIFFCLLWQEMALAVPPCKEKPHERQEQAGQTTLVFPPYLHTYGIRKATQSKLLLISKLSGFHTRFDNPQGVACVRLLSWEDSATQHDDDEVTVYGVNAGRHQILYNTSMYRLAIFGSDGSGKNQFRDPRGIAADALGRVYVCDKGNNRVVKLFNPGQSLRWVSATKQGCFNSPHQIALTSWGDLYITDFGNNRIVVMDSSLHRKAFITGGSHGLLQGPTAVALCDSMDPWLYPSRYYRAWKKKGLSTDENRLYVADRHGSRIVMMDLHGNWIKTVDAVKERGYTVNYQYMACDYYGNLYLTEMNRGCVHKYSPDLEFLESYGRAGRGDKEFDEPRGIAIHRRFGQLFVAEREGAQYYWIGTDVRDLKIIWEKEEKRYYVDFFCTEHCYLHVDLLLEGKVSAALVGKRRFSTGKNRCLVSIPAKSVHLYPNQKQNFLVTFEPTYSSYTYFWKQYKRPFP